MKGTKQLLLTVIVTSMLLLPAAAQSLEDPDIHTSARPRDVDNNVKFRSRNPICRPREEIERFQLINEALKEIINEPSQFELSECHEKCLFDALLGTTACGGFADETSCILKEVSRRQECDKECEEPKPE